MNAFATTLRMTWTVVTILVIETLVLAISLAPVVTVGIWLFTWLDGRPLAQVVFVSLAAGPAYAAFTLALLIVTPAAVRLTGWRTPHNAEMRLADLSWPLLRWVRFLVLIHVARVFAGGLLRGSPLWTAHVRWCGGRMGRRVYLNSLSVSDYNLLHFDDDVVIGGAVHLSGHTVEGGVVKTGTVTLGRGVTVGLGSIVEIDVEIAEGCQIGAMSFVPKHARLSEPGTYVGVPAAKLDRRTASRAR